MSIPRTDAARVALLGALVAMVVAFAMALAPSSASAAGSTYYFGDSNTNLLRNSCLGTGCVSVKSQGTYPLWTTSARTVNGNTGCTTAFSVTGAQVGTVKCSDDLASKDDFCGCEYRYGGSRGTINQSTPRGRAQLSYY